MIKEQNEPADVKISKLLVCSIFDTNGFVKTSIFIRSFEGKNTIYTDVVSDKIYYYGYGDHNSLAKSIVSEQTLEQGYTYSSVFKRYLAENDLTEEDSISIAILKEQVYKMNEKENNKKVENESIK